MDEPKTAPARAIYQATLYWGIHYDVEIREAVREAARSSARFAALGDGRREIRSGPNKQHEYFRGSNSDFEPTREFIAVENMRLDGDEYDRPEDTFVEFEPANLVKAEKKYADCMQFITELYNVIIARLKKDKVSYVGKIYLGWSSTTCSWENDPDDESVEQG